MTYEDKNLSALLERDPLHEASQLTGLRSSEDDTTAMLGFILAMDHGSKVERALRARGDSDYGMSREDFQALAESLGFRELLRVPFMSPSSKVEEVMVVMWRSGVLLRFDTFKWPGDPHHNVNTADMYYDLRIPRALWEAGMPSGSMHSGGGHDSDADYVWWSGNHDVRVAFKHKFNLVKAYAQDPWKKAPYYSLSHHGDENRGAPGAYKKIAEDRLSLLGEVGEMIRRAE